MRSRNSRRFRPLGLHGDRTATDKDGKAKGETIIRFDPSKRMRAFTPLKLNGTADEKQLRVPAAR